ncbi:MAG: hypothetical protein ACRD1L_09310 [Terriglobales bacterium]
MPPHGPSCPATVMPRLARRDFIGLAAASAAALGLPAPALPLSAPERLVLYISDRVNAALVRALGPTRFNVAILAFLYARYRGGVLHLTYNGVPARRLPAALAPELRRLRLGFATPKRILISIGGWGNRGTFEAIRAAGVERFLDQLDAEFVGPLGLEGLDLDLEPSTVAENTPAGWRAVHDDLGATLVAITNGYMRRHPHHAVTHAPIASVAAALYAGDGKLRGVRGSFFDAARIPRGNHIAWLNLQFYEAGDPKPVSIPDFYRNELVLPLLARRDSTGIARPWEVLVPGFEPRYHQDRDFCEQTLRQINHAIAPMGRAGGVFLWQYGQVAATVAAWSDGLARALSD